jgi:DNA polymerase eta
MIRGVAHQTEFEAVRIGSPDHVPLIVVQWETIIAVNYPARKFGIKRYSQSASTSPAVLNHLDAPPWVPKRLRSFVRTL